MDLTRNQMLVVAIIGCVMASTIGRIAGQAEATMHDPNATMSAGCVSYDEYVTMSAMSNGMPIMGVVICDPVEEANDGAVTAPEISYGD